MERGSSKFDVLPSLPTTVLKTAAPLVPAANNTQQTRHARRIYVGNLPKDITESAVHEAFAHAIKTCLVDPSPAYQKEQILSVYINQDRLYSFVEFKNVEITTACMALDGLVVQGHPVNIKRPNDYSDLAAPRVNQIPELDVSRLGIIRSVVEDSLDKIFVGGLPYSLTESQVMELLAAFGKLKAFRLVENEADGSSKGYCFVEYADKTITPVALEGLNGMDIGGGKILSAKLACDPETLAREEAQNEASMEAPKLVPVVRSIPSNRTIIMGYDIEELIDAAMGEKLMPLNPIYIDSSGQGVTQLASESDSQTRVLVLFNVVTDDDLVSEDDREALKKEIREECEKFGKLETVYIPKHDSEKRCYLQYSKIDEALGAQQALNGRQFGNGTVETQFCSEEDFEKAREN